jgi:hypothetical protein
MTRSSHLLSRCGREGAHKPLVFLLEAVVGGCFQAGAVIDSSLVAPRMHGTDAESFHALAVRCARFLHVPRADSDPGVTGERSVVAQASEEEWFPGYLQIERAA